MQAIVDGILGVPIQPVRNWNKVVDGQKVKGDHKKTDPTTRKPETLAEIGGKINISLRNFNAKKSVYGPGGYKRELIRYLKELKELGGKPSDVQWQKAMNLNDEEIVNVLQIFADGPQVQEPDDNRVEEQTEAVTEQMVRPDGTPRRPSPDSQGEQPPAAKRPAIEPRVLNTPAATAAPTAAPTASATVPAMDSSSMGASGGNDPAGNGAMWESQSFQPQYSKGDDCDIITFGGSRMQYTWALDMRSHNVDGYGDFVPVGHTVPWHWIPFYCTPTEWGSLPWRSHLLKIKRVGVSVTPIGKEVQFNTASGTSTIASNEHLALGFKAVGLNKREDIPAFGLRRVKNNESTSTLITSTSADIDYKDLRTRYWGPLSDFTVNEVPARYSTTSQVSCAELSIRENEIVSGIYVDKFDKTTKANNKASFGAVLLDRYVTRFPLMPAMGKPIIREVYSPQCGMLNTQPHRICIENSKGPLVGDKGTAQVYHQYSNTINNKFDSIGNNAQVSRNTNVAAEKVSQLGSYHATVEKFRMLNITGMYKGGHSGQVQPSITFGMAPIRLIDITASAPSYVNARCVWKIDYFIEIEARMMKPEHCFATTVSANGSVYPDHMYISPIPRVYNLPTSWNETITDQPTRENLNVESQHITKGGYTHYHYDTSTTVNDIAGASYISYWPQSNAGLFEV